MEARSPPFTAKSARPEGFLGRDHRVYAIAQWREAAGIHGAPDYARAIRDAQGEEGIDMLDPDAGYESAHCGVAPGFVVGEHVASDEMHDSIDYGVGKAQTSLALPPLCARNTSSWRWETRFLARFLYLGLGLAYVVEERGEAQFEFRRRSLDARIQVVEDVEYVHAPLLDSSARGEGGADFLE